MFRTSSHKPPPDLNLFTEFPPKDAKGQTGRAGEIRCKDGQVYVHTGKAAVFSHAGRRKTEQVEGTVALLRSYENALRSSVPRLQTNDATITQLRQRTVTRIPVPALSVGQIDSKTVGAGVDESATVAHVLELRSYCTELAQVLAEMRPPEALAAQEVLNYTIKNVPAEASFSKKFLAGVAQRLANPGTNVAKAWQAEAAEAEAEAEAAETTDPVNFHPLVRSDRTAPAGGSTERGGGRRARQAAPDKPATPPIHETSTTGAPSTTPRKPLRKPPPLRSPGS